MSAYADGPDKSHDSIEPRTVRALTECMSALPCGGGVFDVVSESGKSYAVDTHEGRCTCPDAQHRDPDGGCKHERRVRFATGERPVPADVDPDAVDGHLGEHCKESPRVAVTDGGEAVADGVDPEDCDCDEWDDEFPCFACFMAGAEFD